MSNYRSFQLTIHFLLLFLFFITACGKKGDQPAITKNLDSILAQKEYFKLRQYYTEQKSKLPRRSRLYYGAFIANAFNQVAASQKIIDSLEREFAGALSAREQVGLWRLKRDNALKQFRY